MASFCLAEKMSANESCIGFSDHRCATRHHHRFADRGNVLFPTDVSPGFPGVGIVEYRVDAVRRGTVAACQNATREALVAGVSVRTPLRK